MAANLDRAAERAFPLYSHQPSYGYEIDNEAREVTCNLRATWSLSRILRLLTFHHPSTPTPTHAFVRPPSSLAGLKRQQKSICNQDEEKALISFQDRLSQVAVIPAACPRLFFASNRSLCRLSRHNCIGSRPPTGTALRSALSSTGTALVQDTSNKQGRLSRRLQCRYPWEYLEEQQLRLSNGGNKVRCARAFCDADG